MDERKPMEHYLFLVIMGVLGFAIAALPIVYGMILAIGLYLAGAKWYHSLIMSAVVAAVVTWLYKGISWIPQYFILQINTFKTLLSGGIVPWLKIIQLSSPFAIVAGLLLAALMILWLENNWGELASILKLGKANHAHPEGGISFGENEKGQVISESFDDLKKHLFLVGASGIGKTVTIKRILDGEVGRVPAVFVDFKGDKQLAEEIKSWNPELVDIISLEGDIAWNPLAHGNANELRDKIMAWGTWSEPYYRTCALRYLTELFNVLTVSSEVIDLHTVAKYLDYKDLDILARKLPKEYQAQTDKTMNYLDNMEDGDKSAAYSLKNMIQTLTESEAGKLFRHSETAINLYDSILAGRVTIFSVSALKYKDTAQSLGTMLLLDLQTIASDFIDQGKKLFCPVTIDEFAALEGEHVIKLLEQARGAGMGTTLATQSISQLDKISDTYASTILDCLNTVIIMQIHAAENAERMAKMIGTRTVEIVTEQINTDPIFQFSKKTGGGSMREGQEFIINPDTIKQIQQGEAIIHRFTPRMTEKIKVFLPNR